MQNSIQDGQDIVMHGHVAYKGTRFAAQEAHDLTGFFGYMAQIDDKIGYPLVMAECPGNKGDKAAYLCLTQDKNAFQVTAYNPSPDQQGHVASLPESLVLYGRISGDFAYMVAQRKNDGQSKRTIAPATPEDLDTAKRMLLQIRPLYHLSDSQIKGMCHL